MRGIFDFILRLIALVVLIFIATAIWIIFDGLSDKGDPADVAVVPGSAVLGNGMPGPVLRARLDRTAELYHAGKFPLVIVSGSTQPGGYDEPAAMANYLVEHEVPRNAIIQDKLGANTSDTGVDVEKIMKDRHLMSAMIVTNYYHVTRTKLALTHAGVQRIRQMHVGTVDKADAMMLGREVIALYDYLGRFYLLPAAAEAQKEAAIDSVKLKKELQAGGKTAKEEADKAKQKVNDGLDSLKK